MVKNKSGGNKSKRSARKHNTEPIKTFTRYADDPDELYASVTKYFGCGNVDVKCCDGVSRLGVIRKKFKGRNRRDNMINQGSYVLVGIRSWEVIATGKKQKCDILEIYSSEDIKNIKKYMTEEEWEVIAYKDEDETGGVEQDDGFEFADEDAMRYEAMMEDKTNKKIAISTGGSGDGGSGEAEKSDDDIDIDDI